MLLFQVDYMSWADREILRACSALSSEELNRDLGISHGGLLGTLRHMFVAEYDWLIRLRHGMEHPKDEVDPELLFPGAASGLGLAELKDHWAAVWPAWRAFIESLPEQALDQDFLAMGDRIPRWRLIQHVVNHATLHRGQVMGMLRQLGSQPPCTDLFEYHKVHTAAA